MFLHKLLYQRQTYAGIAAVIIYCQRLKHHEYLIMIFRRNAGSIIGYCEFIILTKITHRNPYMAQRALAVLDAVPDQVGKYLGQV